MHIYIFIYKERGHVPGFGSVRQRYILTLSGMTLSAGGTGTCAGPILGASAGSGS